MTRARSRPLPSLPVFSVYWWYSTTFVHISSLCHYSTTTYRVHSEGEKSIRLPPTAPFTRKRGRNVVWRKKSTLYREGWRTSSCGCYRATGCYELYRTYYCTVVEYTSTVWAGLWMYCMFCTQKDREKKFLIRGDLRTKSVYVFDRVVCPSHFAKKGMREQFFSNKKCCFLMLRFFLQKLSQITQTERANNADKEVGAHISFAQARHCR